ncbi:hypothetical protein ACQ4PT_018249 [Festuca glaucescens]
MGEHAVEVEVPSYFLCPTTLDVMRDPVTLPTGITYDRHAIHRWLRLADGATSATCPLTKLPVAPDCEPTPNHTLRRLIHSWCALNPGAAVDSIERVSTPPASANRARLGPLVSRLADPKRPERETLAALREIRDVAGESEPGRELVASFPGAAEALFAVLVSTSAPSEADMALDVISSLRLSEQCLVRAVDRDCMALVDALVPTRCRGRARRCFLRTSRRAWRRAGRCPCLSRCLWRRCGCSATTTVAPRLRRPRRRDIVRPEPDLGRGSRRGGGPCGSAACRRRAAARVVRAGSLRAGPAVRVRGGARGAGGARRRGGCGGEDSGRNVGGGEREGRAGAAVGGAARGNGGGGVRDGGDWSGDEAVRRGGLPGDAGEDEGEGAGDASDAC